MDDGFVSFVWFSNWELISLILTCIKSTSDVDSEFITVSNYMFCVRAILTQNDNQHCDEKSIKVLIISYFVR